MAFYSPFTQASGEPKTIYELTYQDLQQLQDKKIESGWQIEYRLAFTQAIQDELPRIVSSFANDFGGWLFIGINGETLQPAPIAAGEYKQIITGLLKNTVSPQPKVEIAFLPAHSASCAGSTDGSLNASAADTDSCGEPSPGQASAEGVWVIWVSEGTRPPYICKGNIYRRSALGATPAQNSAELDRLFQRAQVSKASIKEFCKNELTVNNSYWNSQVFRYIDRGMCNIYILPAYSLQLTDRLQPAEWLDAIIAGSRKKLHFKDENGASLMVSVPWARGYYAANSLVFRNSPLLDHYKNSTAWELFWDGRARFHVPIPYIDLDLPLWQGIKGIEKKDILNDFNFIDGKEFITRLIGCIACYNATMEKYFPELNEMLLIVELENVARDVLYFKGQKYDKFLHDKGLVFSEKSQHLINKEYVPVTLSSQLPKIMEYLQPVWNAFGLSVEEGRSFFNEVVWEKIDYNGFTITSR